MAIDKDIVLAKARQQDSFDIEDAQNLREALTTQWMLRLLNECEKEYLAATQMVAMQDLSTQEGVFRAIKAQGMMTGIAFFLDSMLSLANKGTENDESAET